ncbi:hypothetical protein D4764_06G0013890 [Takifugu flavidus]|uniref:Uncharacterized protein n=1 Tax=Takifugu flavidus TaxID=433684 RepID=A0A5C6MYU3_9TELE|nr:hypothetical protein D4764_06G0013890 [Takifugu flavidus]
MVRRPRSAASTRLNAVPFHPMVRASTVCGLHPSQRCAVPPHGEGVRGLRPPPVSTLCRSAPMVTASAVCGLHPSQRSLRSNPTHLKELDLSFNHPGDDGTKQLSAVLEDPELSLEVSDHCELSVDTTTPSTVNPMSNNRVMRKWPRTNHIQPIQRGFRTVPSCCVATA